MKAKPIVPWLGGKTRLADQIISLFPDHQCYVEPFAGAAGVLFKKEPTACEVLNDVNYELINLYRVLQYHLDEFVNQFRWTLVSRQLFDWQKKTDPETLTDIQRAARFYYLQKCTFGANIEGQTFGTSTVGKPGLNLRRLEEDLSAAHLRLAQVFIENLDWQACIKKYDREHTLFFCAPPYWGTTGYGVDFGLEQYQRMAELADSIKGKMVITVNDHPDMRTIFKRFPKRTVAITYTCNNTRTDKRTEAKELLIQSSKTGFKRFKPKR